MKSFWPAWMRRPARFVTTTAVACVRMLGCRTSRLRRRARDYCHLRANRSVVFCNRRNVAERVDGSSRRLNVCVLAASQPAAHVRRDAVHVGRDHRSGFTWSVSRADAAANAAACAPTVRSGS